jgi:N-acetylmuramoyl-L-alanine amidase CwlA
MLYLVHLALCGIRTHNVGISYARGDYLSFFKANTKVLDKYRAQGKIISLNSLWRHGWRHYKQIDDSLYCCYIYMNMSWFLTWNTPFINQSEYSIHI